jgi:hypothetical protein
MFHSRPYGFSALVSISRLCIEHEIVLAGPSLASASEYSVADRGVGLMAICSIKSRVPDVLDEYRLARLRCVVCRIKAATSAAEGSSWLDSPLQRDEIELPGLPQIAESSMTGQHFPLP